MIIQIFWDLRKRWIKGISKRDVIWMKRTVVTVEYCLLMNLVKMKYVTSRQPHNLHIFAWEELNLIANTVTAKAVT